MLRFLSLMLILGLTGLAVTDNIERWLLFHFDSTRIAPGDAGEARLREHHFDPGDGTDLIVWVAQPADNRPTILYFHGNAGNLAMRTGRFSHFLNQGYGVVAMGYRGSSGSTGTPSVDAIQKDAEALYLALPTLIGHGPVVLYGESLGTGIAALLAARVAADSDMDIGPAVAMVLEAPYTSILDIGRLQYPSLAGWLEKLPDRWPTKDWIGTNDTPLLVLHGAKDTVIPVDMGCRVFALSGARDKQIYVVPNAGHSNVWQPATIAELFKFLGRF